MSLVFPARIDSSGHIEYPSYTAYFNVDQSNKKATTLEKAQACAQRSFQLVGIFFVSFKDALFRTLGGAGTSFKYIVLGYYGSWNRIHFPENVHLIIFKIIFWTASMGWGIVVTTSRLFSERASIGHSLFLEQFASDEIDVDHMKTEESSLDASNVPADIQVNTLLELFDAINFTDENAPGYMPETSRQEGTTIFTREQLRKSLKDEEKKQGFIENVNTRKAFLGTPPAHDVPRLMDFYQQIEDAVRLSIYKVVKDVTDFEEENKNASGAFSYDELAEDKKRGYKNLLETRARVALDLAIAGKYCGARYMGEAMDVYYSIYSKEGISNDKDLQGTLIEILAKKREEIAKEEVQKLGPNTHSFTKYMGTMGRLLGIPGTKNIIEHLSTGIDTYQLLEDFFQKYTVDTIINAIQEKVKTSQYFREKITDWIKDQINDWNHEKYEDIDSIAKKIEDIRNNPLKKTPLSSNFQIFQDLLIHLKDKKIVLSKLETDWDNFLEFFFTLSEIKEKLRTLFPFEESKENQMEYRVRFLKLLNNIKASCSQVELGSELFQELQKAIASGNFTPILSDRYLPRFMEKHKIQEMKKVLPLMGNDTLLRLLNDEIGLRESIQNYQEQVRRGDFLDFLDLEKILEKITSVPTEDLTDAENKSYQRLIEWILVSQKILKPQIESSQIDLAKNQARSYVQTVYKEAPIEVKKSISSDKLVNLLRNKEENVEEIFSRISAPDIRYRGDVRFKRDAVLAWVFNRSFQRSPTRVVAAAENVSKQAFYPKWKKVCLIQLPKVSADIFCNSYFKAALTASVIFVSVFSIYQAHVRVSELFAVKGIPFIINQVPVQVIRAGNAIIEVKELIERNSLKAMAIIFLTREGIIRLPEIPYLSAAARSINLRNLYINLFLPQTIFSFALARSIFIIDSVFDASQEIAQRFHTMQKISRKERERTYRQKSLRVWKKSCQVALA